MSFVIFFFGMSNFTNAQDEFGGGEPAFVFAGVGPGGEVSPAVGECLGEVGGELGDVAEELAEHGGEDAVGLEPLLQQAGGGEGDLDRGAVETGDGGVGGVANDDHGGLVAGDLFFVRGSVDGDAFEFLGSAEEGGEGVLDFEGRCLLPGVSVQTCSPGMLAGSVVSVMR